jgi:competence protein ComFC
MILAGQIRPAYFLYRSLWAALDLVFPPTCGGCGKVGQRWCEDCQQKIERIEHVICPCCGEPGDSTELCYSCKSHPIYFTALRSFGIFGGPLREALRRLKYQRDIGIGDSLSKHLIELYNDLNWEVDLVAPVPLGKQRLQERGYNQSSLLGRPFAYAIQKPYRPTILQKARETQSQVSLSRNERRQNVEGAFKAREAQVRGKVVLIIDDVTTTSSTINACAQALCNAGASAVFGLTLARAVQQADADDQPTKSQIDGGKYGSRGRNLS